MTALCKSKAHFHAGVLDIFHMVKQTKNDKTSHARSQFYPGITTESHIHGNTNGTTWSIIGGFDHMYNNIPIITYFYKYTLYNSLQVP